MINYVPIGSKTNNSGFLLKLKMQLRQALHFFQLISRSNLQPTVISFNAIISAFEKGGQWQFALKLGEMSER